MRENRSVNVGVLIMCVTLSRVFTEGILEMDTLPSQILRKNEYKIQDSKLLKKKEDCKVNLGPEFEFEALI